MGKSNFPSFDFSPKYLSGIENWHPHMPFAHDLLREHQPKTIVELGVHYGDSYFCFCQSVKELNLDSLCYAVDTWEGDKQAGLYNDKVFEQVEQHNARFYSDFSYLLRMPFDIASEQFAVEQIDLLHIDGLHTYDAVSEDFNLWIDRVSPGGIVLLHDVTCRELGFGVWQFWEEIKNDYPSFLFGHGHGLGIIKKAKLDSPMQFGEFNFSSHSANEIKTRYAHAYKLMRAMLLFENQQEKQSDLENKRREILEKQQIAGRQLGDILLKNDLLEKKIEEQFKDKAAVEVANQELARKLEKFELICSERTPQRVKVVQSKGQLKLVSWIEPKQKINLIFGTVLMSAVLTFDDEEIFESFFIRLGKRSIPCEIEPFYDKNEGRLAKIEVTSNFTIGNGLKLCRLYGESKTGQCHLLGWRLYYSISPPSRKLLNYRHLFSIRDKRNEYSKWLKYNEFGSRHRSFWDSFQILRRSSKERLFSFIMPVFETPLAYLREAVSSILDQSYPHWELCIVNDGSTNHEIHDYLSELSSADSRIIYSMRESNGGIALATNDAIGLSNGEFLVFVDHDDTIEPSALSEINAFVASNENIDFLYTDDDKIDLEGNRYSPQFKPDWSPELLLSYCYVSHMKIVRRTVSEEVGHVRTGYDGSQDYDYILRVCEVARKIGHIPKVLYHWRASPSSTAASGLNKPNSFDAGKRAVQDCFDRRGINALVSQTDWAVKEGLGIFKPNFPDSGPSVNIIIPTRNNAKLLKRCLASLELTTYQNYKITIIDNESDDTTTVDFLQETEHRVLKILNNDHKFNFSYLVNKGVEESSSKYVLLLNDDTEVLAPCWLSQMVGYLSIEGVGVVGAKLFFPDGKIQHAGIINNILDGLPAPAFRGFDGKESGYLNYLRVARNYKAVTAACLLTTRKLFQEIGGFDESNLAVAYNDVDFCYRVTERAKKRCVYSPEAQLIHKEGSSRGSKDDYNEIFYFKERYGNQRDPYFSPNFSSVNANFSIIPFCLPLPFQSMVNVLAITHNLNLEGAPLSMMEMITGLFKMGKIKPRVISLKDGPLREAYEALGISVRVLSFDALDCSARYYNIHLSRWSEKVRIRDCEMVYANTMNCFFGIDAAHKENVPSVWNIRESSYAKESFGRVSNAVAQRAFKAFQYPYRVIFVAGATRELFQEYNKSNNFALIRNVLAPSQNINPSASDHNFPKEKKFLLSVGTLCKRKAQDEIITAFENLSKDSLEDTALVFLGDMSSSYAKRLETKVNANSKIRKKVYFLGSVEDVEPWYDKACAFVFSSKNESYPRVILEAMRAGLPIITTSVFGVKEQIIADLNAIVYEPGDHAALRQAMEKIISNKDLRNSLSSESKKILKSLGTNKEMLQKYEDIFLETASSS